MSTIQVVIMGEAEARALVEEIKTGITSIGEKLLELYDREGWKALGYTTWRECVTKEFDFSQSRVYQLLSHAEITRNVTSFSTIVEKPQRESQTRPLTGFSPAQQAEAWQQAVQKSGGQPTAKQVETIVKETYGITKQSQTEWKPKPKVATGGFSQINRFDDFNQDYGDENSTQVEKSTTTLEALQEQMSRFDDGVHCPYCPELAGATKLLRRLLIEGYTTEITGEARNLFRKAGG